MSADTLMNIIKARGLPSGLHDIKKSTLLFVPPLSRRILEKREKRKKKRKQKQKNKRSIRKLILIRESAATGYINGVASVNNLNALPDKNI